MTITTHASAIDGPERESRPSWTHRIGVVVAGSLLVGPLVAAALVFGPFGGATEHVVDGAALLGFSLSWALLAVLSTRRTDQPQRWAIVPAVSMAVAGVLLLVWPSLPAQPSYAWAWPVAVLALVGWMFRGSRRELRRRTRRWLLYPVFGVMAFSAVAGTYENVREATDGTFESSTSQLVDVGGHRLHIDCTGTGSPTVVLEAGFGETSAMWGWIAPAVAEHTRVCVYDRAGRGLSEAADGPSDGVAIAQDLHTLLSNAAVPGPFVLVGHSLGGLYVMSFAALFPQDVAGMVLLDSTSPHQFSLPTYPTVYATYRRASGAFPALSRLGVGRLVYPANWAALPPESRAAETAYGSTPAMASSQRDEWAMAPTAMTQASALTTLGSRPLAVVTAMTDAQEGWLPLQEQLAALSSRSVHVVLDDATHTSLTDNQAGAARSSASIIEVVDAVRAR